MSKNIHLKYFAGNTKDCFTLAETLIALVVVGIVAALTIPNLIVKYQKEQTVTRLKKIYSSLSQTTNKAISDYGPITTWEIGEETPAIEAQNFSDKYLIPYLSVSKDCKRNTTGVCKATASYLNSNSKSTIDRTHFFLNDGSMISLNIENSPGYKYARIYIDINGQKKPNKYGKDIFYYIYYVDYLNNKKKIGKFVPAGLIESNGKREKLIKSCNKQSEGLYCAALIMYDGWKISDDYPW